MDGLHVSRAAAGGKTLDAEEVRAHLGGESATWEKSVVRAAVKLPPLAGMIPAHAFVWYCLRHRQPETYGAMLSSLAAGFAFALPTLVHTEIPHCVLPKVCRATGPLRQALRGPDKQWLTMNRFLRRNWGFGAMEIRVLKEMAYADHFQQFKTYTLHALNGAYFSAAREVHYRLCAADTTIAADYVYCDCSRVACQEVMLNHVYSNGILTQAPLKIQPDSRVFGGNVGVAESAGGVRQTHKKRKIVGKSSTYYQLVSMIEALLFILPFDDMTAWASGRTMLGGETERRFWRPEGHHFSWSSSTGASQWVLPRALRQAGYEHTVRVLVMVCDEGSQGWKYFQYLAQEVGLRVMFIRDPPHRLSNMFTNSLRAVPAVISSTLQVMIVHKFRRAPFGGGGFWSSLKEVLKVFLDTAQDDHPLFDALGESITNDHGAPAATDVRQLARSMLQLPLGPKARNS